MKKTTKKASAAAVPAKKTIASAKKAAAPAKAVALTETKPAAPAKKMPAPAKKRSVISSEPPATFISAKIDIGFGNHLYIRGEGPGLSWDRGLAMDCVGAGLWTITVKQAAVPVVFKLLVNDLTWSEGADFLAEPGQSITIIPAF